MYKISIDKELFEDIRFKKVTTLEKKVSKYWQKELLEPSIVNDKIHYGIKQIDSLKLTNGLSFDDPQLIIECTKIDYSIKRDIFEFHLGRILEQKNTDQTDNYKDKLIEDLLKEKAELEESMNKDHLTGVYNRRKMESDLEMFSNQANSHMLVAIFIDADRFKGINDNFGHDAGDRALVYLSKKIQRHANYLNGEAYRYGGEEFLILGFTPKEQVPKKLEDLSLDIKSQKVYHSKKDISLTVSMGVAFFSKYRDKNLMIKKADEAVYRAKDNGRDRVEYA